MIAKFPTIGQFIKQKYLDVYGTVVLPLEYALLSQKN